MPYFPKIKRRRNEGKIITEASLADVLKYSHVGEIVTETMTMPAVVFDTPQHRLQGLLRIAISDINQSRFDEYRSGILLFGAHYLFTRIKRAEKQKEWFERMCAIHDGEIVEANKKKPANLRYPGFTIYDGITLKNLWTYFTYEEGNGFPPTLGINTASRRIQKKSEARKALRPFLPTEQLEDVLAELWDAR